MISQQWTAVFRVQEIALWGISRTCPRSPSAPAGKREISRRPARAQPPSAPKERTLRLSIALAIFAIGGPETGRASALVHSIGRFRTLEHRAGRIPFSGTSWSRAGVRWRRRRGWPSSRHGRRGRRRRGRVGRSAGEDFRVPRDPLHRPRSGCASMPSEKGNEAPKRLKASTENRHRYLGRGQAPSW